MKNLRQVNIKSRQNYFFNSMNNIKNVDTSLLSTDKISLKSTDSVVYDIKCFKNRANSLYLIFNTLKIIEENNGNNYLLFASTDKKKEALENYTEL